MTEQDPDRAYSPLDRARKLYEEGLRQAGAQNLSEAARLFQEVIAQDPNHVGARCNLGAIYRQMGQMNEAIGCLLEALEIDSTHARCHANIGAAFFDKGMIEDAEMAFSKAIQLDPTMAEAHFNLALLYYGRKQYDHAWNHAKNASDLGMQAAQPLLEELERALDQ
jgi:tetratricopeptide (TPR) repeat protein